MHHEYASRIARKLASDSFVPDEQGHRRVNQLCDFIADETQRNGIAQTRELFKQIIAVALILNETDLNEVTVVTELLINGINY